MFIVHSSTKKIKSTISKPCIMPERKIANSGNFRGYQIYSRGLLRIHDDKHRYWILSLMNINGLTIKYSYDILINTCIKHEFVTMLYFQRLFNDEVMACQNNNIPRRTVEKIVDLWSNSKADFAYFSWQKGPRKIAVQLLFIGCVRVNPGLDGGFYCWIC